MKVWKKAPFGFSVRMREVVTNLSPFPTAIANDGHNFNLLYYTRVCSKDQPFMDISFIPALIGIIIGISVHEAAHAWTAWKLGDPTAKYEGRVTLNPIAHLDPLGTLFIIFTLLQGFGIGWGKPTPFNPWNLKNPRRDSALISLAGPISNLALAALLALIIRFVPALAGFLFLIIVINVSLAIFNLVPVSPLDGFKIVGGLLPPKTALSWYSLERYGIFFLILLCYYSFISFFSYS